MMDMRDFRGDSGPGPNFLIFGELGSLDIFLILNFLNFLKSKLCQIHKFFFDNLVSVNLSKTCLIFF